MLQSAGNAEFTTTHWSAVLHAGEGDSPAARAALERLCAAYWYPLYLYARRRGHNPHDAQDHTQDFFALLLERNWFAQARPEKGRFRSYLLASFQYYLNGAWDRAQAAKRGGGKSVISLDALSAEERYALEPVSPEPPERAYDQHWALTLLDQAMKRLREEFASAGKAAQFERLKIFLSTEVVGGGYDGVAAALNLSPSAVAVAVHRLRQRYAELVRAEVIHTVATPADLENELRYLLSL